MRNSRASRLLTPPPDSHVTLQRPPEIPNPSPQKKQRFLASIRSRPSRKRLDRSKPPEPPAEQVVRETSEAFPDLSGDFLGEYGGNEGNELGQDVMESVPRNVEGILPPGGYMDSVNSYEVFAEAVATEAIPFFQLVSDLYVVTGWDSRLAKRTAFWYHIQMDRNESGDKFPVCYCPSARETGICVHQRYLNEEESLESWTSEGLVTHVILFWRDVIEEGWMNLFSVCIDGLPSVAKHRVVVTYAGADTGFGNWKCSRDGINRCAHVQKCQVYLGKLLTANSQVMSDHGYSTAITDQVHAKAVVKTNRHCISHLPVMVSDWARIPSDQMLYPVPPLVDRVPELLTLTREARCSCGHQFHWQESDIFERPCTVYTLLRPFFTRIQLQKCPSCKSIRYPSKAIGPDCRELGIFNFNNSLLFSHDLLDEYTSSFTSSETSFSAWILVLVRRYRKWSPPRLQQSFVEESVFRKVWFGYVNLLDLSEDMVCPRCGPNPEAIIWDGVTLAYGKKQVLDTIYPPTSKHHDAVVRGLRYPKNQYLVEDTRLRKLLSSIMSAPLSLPNIFSRNNNTTIDISVVEATIEKLREVEDAIQLVGEKCGGLHYLLISYYGAVQLKTKGEPAVEARRFFAQVCFVPLAS
ncbi:hypothetical protein Agabi119p4_10703 [Agaricus bisporus var. burnettii]|uniref:HMG domain-containing protein n=1 Tax=Agaricus bisporus var. burnettii TaxID=192524 RepID=A0A8H7C233_AGABI|nr:hypothetical protein Agabi119p4_10703 [Agaricus bisporus var. burnettii]